MREKAVAVNAPISNVACEEASHRADWEANEQGCMQAVKGNTPLHMAVLHGNAKMTSQMVAALQENGGNVDIPNTNGDTVRPRPMHLKARESTAA